MKKIKMFNCNGALYPKTKQSSKHLKSTRLKCTNGFLSESVLKKHVELFNFKLEVTK